jgi:hypothetical protein
VALVQAQVSALGLVMELALQKELGLGSALESA